MAFLETIPIDQADGLLAEQYAKAEASNGGLATSLAVGRPIEQG